ncbi:MAG: MATE family efflux transporter [Eubacterium sp.]|nr:MATE family efflux transporter [Eubacterium sp.]
MSQTTNKPTENKMGIMPVPRLLFTMALPMMVSMLVQALYNIVDSIFVARINEAAFTSVSLAFPMQNLMIGVATGIGVGMNALLSKKLGEKEFETADRAAMQGLLLAFCAYIIFAVLGLTISRQFMLGQNQVPEIVDGGVTYLTIVCVLSFGMFGQVMMERMLQSTGLTLYSMITQITGAVINMIMDPILIFGLLGAPRLGIAGAAIATVFGQITATCLAVYFNISRNKEISLRLSGLKPDPVIIRQILMVGVPSMIMVAIGSVMTFGMNKILGVFTSTAQAVFGAYYKLQSFIFMPVFGLNNGMVPIIAYNYGARNKDRIQQTIKLSIITAVCIMLAGLLVLHIFTGQLLGFFNASDQLLAIGIPALRIISLSYIFAGFCIVAGSIFQAFGNGIFSMIVSILRQLVVLLPLAWLFSLSGNLTLVWWSFPLAELMSLLMSVIFLRRIHRTIISKL